MKTKLPTPQLLPSGMYRCQVMVNGKRVSVVDPDSDIAQAKAVALKNGLIEEQSSSLQLTLGAAIDRYIESKNSILSPTTISGYKGIRKTSLQDIMNIKIPCIAQEQIQRAINKMAKDHSPKSVRNAHGLLSAVLAEYRPNMILRTTLPQKQRYEAAIPSSEDIVKIIEASIGKRSELPILLAIWLGLRASEIRGITWDCINGDILHIKQAVVDGEDGPVVKGTKTYSGDRKIRLPAYIKDLINKQPHTSDYIIQMDRHMIYKDFSRICAKAGLPHFRFHDLRHANASVMLALGVPDKYAMERMGHATNNMLKTVYQHTMKDKQEETADLVDSYFEIKLHTILHTKENDT